MADNFDSWPPVVNDDGSLATGTPFSAEYNDALKATLADQVYSATNPTIKPKAITDEVVAARGTQADLDTRLSNSMDSDGNPLPVAGQASESQLGKQVGSKNLISNSDLQRWDQGATSAPNGYVLSGTGAAIARTGTGESDTTHLNAGAYTAKVTSGGGAAAHLLAYALNVVETPLRAIVATDTRKVQASAVIQASVGNVARLVVDDGVTTTTSAYHTGSGTAEFIAIEHTLSAAATQVAVYLEVAAGANVAYIGGMQLVVSDIPPAGWIAERSPWAVGGRVASVSGAPYYATAGTSEETAWTLVGGIPADALTRLGSDLAFEMDIVGLPNTNSKTVKIYVNGSVTFNIASTTASENRVRIIGHFFWDGSDLRFSCIATYFASGSTVTRVVAYGTQPVFTGSVSSNMEMHVSFTTPTAAGDLKLYYLSVDYHP